MPLQEKDRSAAVGSSAIDDAILHLDSIIAHLKDAALKQSNVASRAFDLAPTNGPALQANPNACGELKQAVSNMASPEIPKKNIPKSERASEKLEKGPSNAAPKVSSSFAAEKSELFDKAHIQVGLVLSVEDHPVAEKLYVCKVEVANKELRQVVAGLRKFISKSELLGKKVCVILNLKPAKLAGQVSEAMILAGDSHVPDTQEVVKVLEPPSNSSIGDQIYLQGGTASANPAKQLSSKIWEKIVPLLKVVGGFATFDGTLLVNSTGAVRVDGLPDGSGIH
ncbi:hypothetical protein O6H91_07G062400 [Diphasiastrum complanatum]|uniref:Uncharacterized protein n=1 Tax=Diphasiastrum complanatum TaxID=34168 RepID=A0ACC2D5W7_DIPCM|nr:hypothetical protein O6H91_07G062400 [Diphasiastrum complanatum]